MLRKWNKKYWAGMGVILALTGCTSVADMVGYDTATLNEDAAKSYTQVIQKARGQKALDVSSPTAQRVQRVFARLRPHAERIQVTLKYKQHSNFIEIKKQPIYACNWNQLCC